MNILGIGGILHDASAALLADGKLVSAIEERKLTHTEHPGELPAVAWRECLRIAGIAPSEVDVVSIARPWLTGTEERIHLELTDCFPNARVVVVDHQLAHAASAYYSSPFEHATVVTADRLGDFRCGSRWLARGKSLTIDQELYYPDSLGDLYGRVTRLIGFRSNAEEHKVQWLSASGKPRFVEPFKKLLHARQAAWPSVRRDLLNTGSVNGTFSTRFLSELGIDSDALSATDKADLARSLQEALAETIIGMGIEGEPLCLGGGVAYNTLLIEALERSGRFPGVFVQPAAGNGGTSLGAAYHAWHSMNPDAPRVPLDTMFLGPEFSREEIKQVLENCKLRFRYLLTTENLVQAAVEELNDLKIVAWMQGRMEYGPRALGNRSILASPLNPYSTENLNLYIKHREPFRKFAASIPEEECSEYFEVGANARFLATVGRVKPRHRKTFEHAILGDDIVRIHTVSETDNPLFHRLLRAQGEATGLPVLYNTSFNLFQDPLVCTPRDAVRSFYSSGVDALFAGHFLLTK
ncbi:MAG: carbamoyltransferase [Bryobacterales bacterium]|nr:carbamoyltransferase [Bryobacterales bacterium]